MHVGPHIEPDDEHVYYVVIQDIAKDELEVQIYTLEWLIQKY